MLVEHRLPTHDLWDCSPQDGEMTTGRIDAEGEGVERANR
ncbi:hypothetical protein PCLA_05r0365 [Pseudomonas citronellolis]|nr:hypothetical protein PCLA_05r0365 [Pseudomonas citronellolis]